MTNFEPARCQAAVAELPEYLRAVLKHMANGLATKQIAAELKVSDATVAVYRERLYSRLGVNNLALATRVAVSAKLVG